MADDREVEQASAASAPQPAGNAAKHEVILGTTVAGAAVLDLGKLLATRLLIQAGSGGGKSWLLRRLLEQSHSMVRQIVFDPEGELVTLAERFDYTVCAPDSDAAPIWQGGGAAAARMIFESGRSAILSLSEFELEDMHEFVAEFCRELLRMPQESWHHVVVAFDEAQLFAPQHDKAASKKALIDLARRGRKRGICLVCATQRLSELSKGVVGQLENKLIGLTTLDVDIDRAADVLGMRPINARNVLRKLDPGHFVAFGPALGYGLEDIAVGPVTTRHGILGAYAGRPVTPSMTHEALAASLRAGAHGSAELEEREGVAAQPFGGPLDEDRLRQAVVEFALRHGPAHAANQFEHARRTFHAWLTQTTRGATAEPGLEEEAARPSTAAPLHRRSEQFRRSVVEMAMKAGADVAAGHFGVGRSTVYAWMRKLTSVISNVTVPTPAAPTKTLGTGRRRRGLKVHLNALAPDVKLDRVFGAAMAVLEGESLDEVALRHGRKPVAARRWVQMTLEHVDLGRLGLNAKHTRIERLRSHAHHIVPRLKRALARQKRSIAARS